MLQLAGEGKTEELASLFRTISGFAPAKYHRESLALLADMIAKEGKASAKCQFCGKAYEVGRDELQALMPKV